MIALASTPKLRRTAHDILDGVQKKYSSFHKAYAIDQWMRQHIHTDHSKLEEIAQHGRALHYRNSIQTFQDEQGVCGEQAFLYIVLSREVGLDARFLMKPDYSHAITHVDTEYGPVHVDHVAPQGFNVSINSAEYQAWSGETLEQYFADINGYLFLVEGGDSSGLPYHPREQTTAPPQEVYGEPSLPEPRYMDFTNIPTYNYNNGHSLSAYAQAAAGLLLAVLFTPLLDHALRQSATELKPWLYQHGYIIKLP